VFTPLGWLFRCPTFKEQIAQLKDKEVNTYAFLGYPVLQAADILLYKANYVPVGEDQLPHLELCREIVRRLHSFCDKKILPEPQSLLTPIPRLVGLDGRKMSKSYNNYIALDEEDKEIKRKILSMFTDPTRLRRQDPGHPEQCNVHSYFEVFAKEREKEVDSWCVNAQKGCVECKEILADTLCKFIGPKREKKREFMRKKNYIYDILNEGKKRAQAVAKKTLAEVKEAVGIWSLVIIWLLFLGPWLFKIL
jgi:tryptophanyl-tRNA synthetase